MDIDARLQHLADLHASTNSPWCVGEFKQQRKEYKLMGLFGCSGSQGKFIPPP